MIWSTNTTVLGTPDDVIEALTRPATIRRWSPIDFDLEELAGDRLEAGSHMSGRGLLGRLLAQATDALLAAGALDRALRQIAREVECRARVAIAQ